jgi:hypothetical protein
MKSSMKMHLAISERASRKIRILLGLLAATAIPLIVNSCGKKEETKPAPVSEVAKPIPTEAAKPTAPTSQPAPAVASAKPTPTVTPAPGAATKSTASVNTRDPAAAPAWQRWDNAAARLREIGITVRPSNDPKHMEIVASGGKMGRVEARSVVTSVYRNLGGGAAFVTLYNDSGMPLAEATANGVQ